MTKSTWMTAGAVASLACGGLAACATDDNEAGFGLPTQPAESPFPGERQDVHGTLHVESNGCFTLEATAGERRWVVWPDGAEQAGDQVRLPNSTDAGDGQVLVGTGALIAAEELPDWDQSDGYFASFGTFCDAGARGVVLLDDVRLE